jgi:Zn-dependent protease/CBS domain-containing protein
VARLIPVGTIGGIAVRLHMSSTLSFCLLIFLLASGYFPVVLPNHSEQTYWAAALISALSLYGSMLAHELGHSLVARRRGLEAASITLFMFRGFSDIRHEGERPTDEFLVAVAGPLVSLLIAALFTVARLVLPNASQPLMVFLESVLLLNLCMGALSLLPTLPLDGGRAVRGVLWRLTNDYRRGTELASRVGRGLALGLLGLGLVIFLGALDPERALVSTVLGYDGRLVGGAVMLGAWFVNNGARNAQRQLVLEERFRGVQVAQLMSPEPSTVEPWARVEQLVAEHFVQRGERAVAVVREGNTLMGLVTYQDVRKIPRAEWLARGAGEVMTPLSRLVTVGPDDSVETAVRHMAERHYNQLPVVVDGRLVGMIARINVLRFVNMKDELAA